MQILTQQEYDSAVDSIVDHVFDPLDDSKISLDQLFEAIDGDDAEMKDFKNDIQAAIVGEIVFHHPFDREADGGYGPTFDDLSPAIHGAIVAFSDNARSPDRAFSDGKTGSDPYHRPRDAVAEAAEASLYSDVKRKVYSRMRKTVGKRSRGEIEA